MSSKKPIQVTDVTKSELARIIRSYSGGHIFGVKFIKRTTGEVRTMTCRKNVTRYLKGGQLKYDPLEKDLISGVFDVTKGGYRSINVDGLIGARIDGFEYLVK